MTKELEIKLDPAATDETSASARHGARKRRDPNEPSAVVGLGASAGGVGVLQQFFADMSPDSGLAFAVVMHLSPEHESHLADILQQQTSMPVLQVNEAVKVKPNHIYVIPPNHQLAFSDGMLELRERPPSTGRPVTIDLFFRTLAHSFGQRCVGVILSGTDSDGVIGLKHVRAQGGVTIAQDPDEAEHNSMPLTAISTGMVDWVLPIAQIPAKLMQFVRNEHAMQLPPEILEAREPDTKVEDAPGGETVSDETRATSYETAIPEVLAHVRAQTGHDFTHYKRATVLRRMARRMQVNLIESIPGYLGFLRSHSAEPHAFLRDLLIGVTHFFRDQGAFAALQANVPQLFAGKTKEDQVRAWVVGCATGEEAYSIAMLLSEHAERFESAPTIQVFATDIDEQALLEAREGLYPVTIEADVSQERLKRFFTKDQGRYRVRKSLREKLLFASHNFLSDAPFSRIDFVSCRNLLIYLGPKAQEQAFEVFHFALRSGGLLFIGGSESNNVQGLFAPVDRKHRIYSRRSVPRPIWKVPVLPLRVPEPMPVGGPWAKRALPPLTPAAVEQAGMKSEGATALGQERRGLLFGELHLRLLEQYAPPSIVVNEHHDIVHLSEKAGRYLRFTAGKPSANIFNLIRPELQIELRTTLFSAAQNEAHNVRGAPQAVHFDSHDEVIALHVRRVQSGPDETFFLILFQHQDGTGAAPQDLVLEADVARGLDEEIAHLKQQLATAVEQYEATNEELKAANEELQAINEEMRSATEELQTSKEELQSGNEELTTVNAELKNSVEELSRANADLNNLMGSTDIGTIFLNRQLRVHRFTPSAQKIFNLLPGDIGRPLADITHHLDYDGLMTDVEDVLDRLETIEREVVRDELEVPNSHQRWYLVRIAPHRTQGDRIAGVVVTFIDITRRRLAEEGLRASEERMRRAFEVETVGVIFFRIDGPITNANDAFLKMSGYSRADVKSGRVRLEMMTPAEWTSVSLAAANELKESGHTKPREKEYIRKDGSSWWGMFAMTRLDEENGVKYVLDITPRKEAEAALNESEKRFRQFAENSADVFWIIDTKKKQLEYLNPAYEKMWGEPRDAVMRDLDHWRETVHLDDHAKVAAIMPKVLGGATCVVEYRIIRPKDGGIRWIRDTGFPIPDENGRITRIAGVAQDVTEDRNRTETIRMAEERFRLLVEGAPDYAMFLIDPDNTITYWSSGAEKVFGWSAEEVVGKTADLIFTPEDRSKGAVEKELGIAGVKGFAPDRRWHVRKDGSRLWIDGIMRRLDESDGSIRGYAKIARDATDQHESEDALLHARDEMEQRVVERTAELVAMNNELESAMRARQQLERELLDVSEREKRRIGEDLHDVVCQELTAAALYLKSSANQVEHKDPATAKTLIEAANIVNRNVTLARNLARGLQPVQLSGGQLTVALRTLVAQLNKGHRNISCRAELPRSLHIRDETVALNLYRIAQEAITNAIKHSGADEVVLSLRRERHVVRLTVEDNGTGFRPGKRSKGLGMHIMKYRTTVLNGNLTVESKPKHGTRITSTVPVKSLFRESE